MTRIVTGALVLLALAAGTASANIRRESPRVDRPPVPAPMPEIIEGDCPGLEAAAGCYIGIGEETVDGRVFERGAVFVYSRHDRFAMLHELGHAFDVSMMDRRERNRFLRFTHQRDLYWTWNYTEEDGTVVQDYAAPAEQFADAYANCRMRHEPGVTVWAAGYNYYPKPKQHRRICASITRAALDPGRPPVWDGYGAY